MFSFAQEDFRRELLSAENLIGETPLFAMVLRVCGVLHVHFRVLNVHFQALERARSVLDINNIDRVFGGKNNPGAIISP